MNMTTTTRCALILAPVLAVMGAASTMTTHAASARPKGPCAGTLWVVARSYEKGR
jgi:hypothetical protein